MTREEMDELRYLVHWYRQQTARAAYVERRQATCSGKDAFPTHNQAARTISPRLARYCHAYQCSVCHQWHVGGRRAARDQRIGHMMDRRNGK